jgi:hypothetical protein
LVETATRNGYRLTVIAEATFPAGSPIDVQTIICNDGDRWLLYPDYGSGMRCGVDVTDVLGHDFPRTPKNSIDALLRPGNLEGLGPGEAYAGRANYDLRKLFVLPATGTFYVSIYVPYAEELTDGVPPAINRIKIVVH